MARAGVCSECGEGLKHVTAKTCSQPCRQKRARRIAAARKAGGENTAYPPHLQHLSHVSEGKAKDLSTEVLKEELRPVVREAITEDVLRAAGDLVRLTPVMVQAIEEDLHSDDKLLRQKAYSLLARYTLGNQSIAPAAAEQSQAPMQVVFNMPRHGDPVVNESAVESEYSDELRTCMECQAEKSVSEFVGPSERCQACHDTLRRSVLDQFG